MTAFVHLPGGGEESWWFVVDPALPAAEVMRELRRRSWAEAPSPWWARWLYGAVAIAGAVVGVELTQGVAHLHEWASLAAGAVIGAVVAAGLLAVGQDVVGAPSPGPAALRQVVRDAVDGDGVVTVPVEFRTWAEERDPPLSHDDLADLARRLSDTADAAGELDLWRAVVRAEASPRAFALVDPIYLAHHAAARSRLDEVAARLGFPVPSSCAPDSLR
jgi:hypothetical protein